MQVDLLGVFTAGQDKTAKKGRTGLFTGPDGQPGVYRVIEAAVAFRIVSADKVSASFKVLILFAGARTNWAFAVVSGGTARTANSVLQKPVEVQSDIPRPRIRGDEEGDEKQQEATATVSD